MGLTLKLLPMLARRASTLLYDIKGNHIMWDTVEINFIPKAQKGNVEIVEELLRHGANVEAKFKNYYTPLHAH